MKTNIYLRSSFPADISDLQHFGATYFISQSSTSFPLWYSLTYWGISERLIHLPVKPVKDKPLRDFRVFHHQSEAQVYARNYQCMNFKFTVGWYKLCTFWIRHVTKEMWVPIRNNIKIIQAEIESLLQSKI